MSNILMCGTDPVGQVCDIPATDISYDNTTSGITADDVQSAIDEIASYPASKTFKVNRGYSHSSSRSGYWASMLNSTYQSEETAPTLPTDGKWWHVLSMDWMGDPGPGPTTNWCSQLALATEDGYGVWWRRTDSSGNKDIDLSPWHRLAEGDNDGNAIGLKGGVIHSQATPWGG